MAGGRAGYGGTMAESPNVPGEGSADNEIGFYNADEEGSYDEREGQQGEPRPDAPADRDEPAGSA